MFRKSLSILFASFVISCGALRCSYDFSKVGLFSLSDMTGDPYIAPMVERALFRRLGVCSDPDKDFLITLRLDSLKTTSIGHDEAGYSTHEVVELKGSFSLYRKGRVEPFLKKAFTIKDSFSIPRDPSFALTERRASLSRLSVKLAELIRLYLKSYFCGGSRK